MQHRDRADERCGTRRITDAPARHRVGLRHRVRDDRAVAQRRLEREQVARPLAVVADELVDVVDEHRNVRVLGEHAADLGHLRLGVGRAGRVARAVENHHPRLRADRRGELARGELEALRLGRHDDLRRALGEHDHVGVAHPVRTRDHHLVAGIQGRLQDVEQRVLAAAGRDDLVGRVLRARCRGRAW